jgi:hypothetical protein
MRIELAGTLVRPEPLVLKFSVDQTFDIQQYIDLGYTHFDVICIGAGGGTGGGIDTANTGTLVRNYGGAGGGGGFHRVQGLLSALPASCPIVVGVGGAPGTEHISDPAQTTNGENGGASSFNDTTCRASGGEGGKRVQTNSLTVSTVANGGDGGIGNRIIAGGGGTGGIAGAPTPTGPGAPGSAGQDGTFFGNVGKGGGGGAGGVGKYGSGGTTCNAATPGGRGSYNPGNTAVYGPSDTPGADPSSGSQNIVPGGASGAKAAPLNGLPTVYGQSKGERVQGDPGVVIIRLTAE